MFYYAICPATCVILCVAATSVWCADARRAQREIECRSAMTDEEFRDACRRFSNLDCTAIQCVRKAFAEVANVTPLQILPSDSLAEGACATATEDADADDAAVALHRLLKSRGYGAVLRPRSERLHMLMEVNTAEEWAALVSDWLRSGV